MKLSRFDLEGKPQGEIEIQEDLLVLNARGTQAVSDSVVAYLANQRQGNAKTKTRAEVSGGGKKPWRQKGTGRARAGSIRSPIWRHGGVVFGPQPRDYSQKITKKTKALAFRKAFSERLQDGAVLVVGEFKVDSGKTRDFVKVLRNLKLDGKTLVVSTDADDNFHRASRNVAHVGVTRPEFLNTYQLLRFDHILLTEAALGKLTDRLKAAASEQQ